MINGNIKVRKFLRLLFALPSDVEQSDDDFDVDDNVNSKTNSSGSSVRHVVCHYV